MTRLVALLIVLGVSIIGGYGPAQAATRAALVIGINDYDEVTDLEKAVGDARAMGTKLRELGFVVTEVLNADRRTLNQAVASFAATLSDGDTAFVHFSGHGVEIDGENYLLPADIPTPQSGQRDFVKSEAIAMSELVSRISNSGARTRVFVIDACRNNPFEEDGVRGVGGTRGLARVEAPAGTFIMYSAGYRQQALDRLGEDDTADTSVYTRTLVQHLGTPGAAIDDIAQDVRREVQEMARTIGHTQRPAYYDELTARLILVEGADEPTEVTNDPVVVTNFINQARQDVRTPVVDEAGQVWGTIQTTDSVAVLEAFVEQFPQSVYARFAHARLDELREPDPVPPPIDVEPPDTSLGTGGLIRQVESLRDAGNYNEAFSVARRAADLGSAEGMFWVAYAYDYGEGVTLDDVEGSKWYLRAAEAGHAQAQFNLAWNYDNAEGVTENPAEAARWYRRAADQGHASALGNLARLYDNGRGVELDDAEAARLYRLAAEKGNVTAMHNLGAMLDDGEGIPRDRKAAARFIFDALSGGNDFSLEQMTDNTAAWSVEFRRELQSLLRQAGLYNGTIDGQFGPGTRSAMEALMRR